MNYPKVIAAITLVVGVVVLIPASYAQKSARIKMIQNPEERECNEQEWDFSSAYITTIENNDSSRFWDELVHKSSKDCLTDESLSFYENLVSKSFAQHIMPPYTCRVQPFDENSSLNKTQDYAPYPITPSHELTITEDKTPSESASRIEVSRKVVLAVDTIDEHVFLLLGCPNDKGLQLFSSE